ncbi:head-tail adaptor protein [Thalassobius sp. Cn5-15]|jgi:head-tail adaptor|uniref:head-tail adaptor protein n=1 Tax=Thalassobius sp. Cn5-15 TaxID=2917763 RepID=UPI001EF1AA66|nr:head-tail adaptor protein [Thalassobius sp. Cn5-15]MCG7492071.1 head-tail adaptor protein [Thalassobius sp. Cn5-15]
MKRTVKPPPHRNRQLILEAPLQTADGAGGFITTWQALGVLWGAVALRSGREGAGLSQTRLRITLRAAPVGSAMRPAPNQRLREGTRLYLIDSVHESDAGARYLTCLAHEEVVT